VNKGARRRRVIATGLLCSYAVGAAVVAVSFVTIALPPAASQPKAFQADIGLVVRGDKPLSTAGFTIGSPSLDLAPNTNGSLYGRFRIALAENDRQDPGEQIGVVLPVAAIFTISDAEGATVTLREGAKIPKPTFQVSCAPDLYPKDPTILDARDLVTWAGSSTKEKWTVECSALTATVWYQVPNQRTAADVMLRIDGSTVATRGVAILTFEIPDFHGIRQTDFESWSFLARLDSENRGSPSLGSAIKLMPDSRRAAPVVGVYGYSTSIQVREASPPDYQVIDRAFYSLGPTPTWNAKFDGIEFFGATIIDGSRLRFAEWVNPLFWVVLGTVLPVAVAATLTLRGKKPPTLELDPSLGVGEDSSLVQVASQRTKPVTAPIKMGQKKPPAKKKK